MSQTYTWPAEVKSTPPVGGATAANQVLEIAQLTAINTNTAGRGQQPMSGSVPVVVASDQSAIPITAAALPLPAGAATQVTLASIDTKLTSPLTVTGPLTDTQLRATPVPISGTVTTGGLTDTQLRASAVPVSVASVPLPTGAATEATLSALNAKVTAVNTGAVVVSSSALPTGAATSANQTTANTSLSSIDTKTPALGQAAMAASVPVVIASNQSTLPGSNPGAFSSQTFIAGAGATNFDIDCSVGYGTVLLHVKGAGAWGGAGSFLQSMDGTHFFPANACNLGVLDGQVLTGVVTNSETIYAINTAGVKTLRLNMNVTGNNVTVYSGANRDATLFNQIFAYTYVKNDGTWDIRNITGTVTASSGRSKVNIVRNDYGSVNVTTAAYVQLIASTAAITNMIEIFDSSGQTLVLATGGAGSEVDQFYINPGGNGQVPFKIPASTRVSIKAVTATASSGYINLSLMS